MNLVSHEVFLSEVEGEDQMLCCSVDWPVLHQTYLLGIIINCSQFMREFTSLPLSREEELRLSVGCGLVLTTCNKI